MIHNLNLLYKSILLFYTLLIQVMSEVEDILFLLKTHDIYKV